MAHHRAGRLKQAETDYLNCLTHMPGQPDASNLLASIYQHTGRLDAARHLLESLLTKHPNFANAHCNLGSVFFDLGTLVEADASLQRCLQIEPGHIEAQMVRGSVQHSRGDLEEAIASYNTALAAKPDSVALLYRLANAQSDLQQMDAAIANYRKAQLLQPGNPAIANAMGLALRDCGDPDAAINSFQKALDLQPDYADALTNISYLQNLKPGDATITDMQSLMNTDDFPTQKKAGLAFCLAQSFDKNAQYNLAFDYLKTGHELRRREHTFDLDKATVLFGAITSTLNEAFVGRQRTANQERTIRPDTSGENSIFVIGMPRSGTTLIEQILASHSAVYGAGEQKILGRLCDSQQGQAYPDYCQNLSSATVASIAEQYHATVVGLAGDRLRIVDKMPANFLFLGLAAMAFPEAKFVHCQRNPMDTCWSIYKSDFSDAHSYAHDLSDLAAYYKLYESLMEHWQSILPGRILQVSYETLIEEQEPQTRRLLDYCDLEYESRCLEFHRTKRIVKTASHLQVRRALYNSSVDAWKPYATHLGDLQKGLQAG
jgi:tetratricopeptide (TPR) repeat protein